MAKLGTPRDSERFGQAGAPGDRAGIAAVLSVLPAERRRFLAAVALHRRGWTISAIARHLGHDRKTIRAYLHGGRVAGQRQRSEPDPFEPFVTNCRERLAAARPVQTDSPTLGAEADFASPLRRA